MAFCREGGATQGRRVRSESALGSRIRARREKLGLSQDKVAEDLGWFAAQVDDCENGLFVPPSRDLFLLADILGVEVSYFQDGVSWSERPAPSADALLSVIKNTAIKNPPAKAEQRHGQSSAIDLFCAYSRIRDARKRALLLDLALSFAREG